LTEGSQPTGEVLAMTAQYLPPQSLELALVQLVVLRCCFLLALLTQPWA
jgi:hypothetical protein